MLKDWLHVNVELFGMRHVIMHISELDLEDLLDSRYRSGQSSTRHFAVRRHCSLPAGLAHKWTARQGLTVK